MEEGSLRNCTALAVDTCLDKLHRDAIKVGTAYADGRDHVRTRAL